MLAVSFTLSTPAMVALPIAVAAALLCTYCTLQDVKGGSWVWKRGIEQWLFLVVFVPAVAFGLITMLQTIHREREIKVAQEAVTQAEYAKERKHHRTIGQFKRDAQHRASSAEERAKQAAQEKMIQEMPEWHGVVKILAHKDMSVQSKIAYVNRVAYVTKMEYVKNDLKPDGAFFEQQTCLLPPISLHMYEYLTKLFLQETGWDDRELRKTFPDLLVICIDPLKTDAMSEFEEQKSAGKYDWTNSTYYKGPTVREYVPEEAVAESSE